MTIQLDAESDALHYSNTSYFASKECTYTDASGRPVPAPRSAHPDRIVGNPPSELPSRSIEVSTGYQPESTQADAVPAAAAVRRQAVVPDTTSKRVRPEAISPSSASGSIGSSPSVDSGHSSPTSLLDPITSHELINRKLSSFFSRSQFSFDLPYSL